MLVLSRKAQEAIVIGEGPTQIRVLVLDIIGGRVRLGFEAEEHVSIRRAELPTRNPHVPPSDYSQQG